MTTPLHRFFRAMSAGDRAAVLAAVTEDAEFIAVRRDKAADLPLYGTYRGHDGIGVFLDKLTAAFETEDFTIHRILGDEAAAFAWGHLRHRVRSTGKIFDCDWAVACDLDKGRISRYQFFEDTAALEAAFRP